MAILLVVTREPKVVKVIALGIHALPERSSIPLEGMMSSYVVCFAVAFGKKIVTVLAPLSGFQVWT